MTNNNNNMTNLSISRTLTSSEQSKLRTQLYTQLNITSNNDEDDINDAENILDYALDMINDGEDVGHVMEEVSEVKKCVLCLLIYVLYKSCVCLCAVVAVVDFIYWLC